MATTLSKVLTAIEESHEAIALSRLAAKLDTSPVLLEGMLDYWVHKGKLRITFGEQDCGSCAKDGDCPFVIDAPKSYELVRDDGLIGLEVLQACDFESIENR